MVFKVFEGNMSKMQEKMNLNKKSTDLNQRKLITKAEKESSFSKRYGCKQGECQKTNQGSLRKEGRGKRKEAFLGKESVCPSIHEYDALKQLLRPGLP